MNYKCLIVDDEPVAQSILERYINQISWLTLVAKCKNAVEATDWLNKAEIDLVFLDIEMPHMNGISFLSSLENAPQVIFTTAYRDYAIDGFDLNAVDYLLKPISFERFIKAINKIVERQSINSPELPREYLYLKVDQKMVKIDFNEILFIQGLSNYVRIFCESRMLISYQKMSYLEEILPDSAFIRSHKSFIINMSKIKSFTNQDVEIGKTEVPIGAKYKEALLAVLNKLQA